MPRRAAVNQLVVATGSVLAVATGAYLASVYLIWDARRLGRQREVEYFRRRAVVAAIVAGAVAFVGAFVLRSDARYVFDGMTARALPLVVLSAVCGVGSLVLLLRRAHWHAASVMSDALRPLGIEMRHFAVLLVLVNRGPTQQRDLVAATGSDKAGIMRVVDDLERKNLAVRKSVPGDRRVRAVEITPAGLDLFDAAHVAAEPLARRLVSGLRPGEPERLADLLTRFTAPAEQ